MGHPLEYMQKIQAEAQVSAATAQLLELNTCDPTDIVMYDREAYWLELCLTPRPRNASVCYLDHWSPHRFELLGNVCLLAPGEAIRARHDGGCSYALVVCHFLPEVMQKWFEGDLNWNSRRLEASLDIMDTTIRSLLFRLSEELRHPGFASSMLVELIVAQLAIELGRHFAQFDNIPSAGKLAPWRLQLIDERLRAGDEVPTLSELATLCDLSVRQLTRGFRASRGHSLGEYAEQTRIDRAKQLLGGDQSIKAIAYSVGFTSPSGFCFAFRRATGMTPGEFRSSGAALQHVSKQAVLTKF